jgi:hypothetical protein
MERLLYFALFAGGVIIVCGLFWLKMNRDLVRWKTRRNPAGVGGGRERRARAERILGRDRIVELDAEGFEDVDAYEELVRRLLASAGERARGLRFTCRRSGARKELEVRAREERFVATLDDQTGSVDLKELLRLLNRALRAEGAVGRFTAMALAADQSQAVGFVTPEQREALLRARLLSPIAGKARRRRS